MTYRANKKARMLWSKQANEAKARRRMSGGWHDKFVDLDPYMKITIDRPATNEHVVIECFEGDRIDNYSVYVNDMHKGIQSISTLTKNIRKALPRFRRMD